MSALGRVLVVGANGQVGGALCEALGAQRAVPVTRGVGPDGGLTCDLEQLCAEPERARALFDAGPCEAVAIAAGFTWVDGCEDDPERAHRVNVQAPAILAEAARTAGARTIYYSTEYVFDGEGGPYAEDDALHPVSVYGQSKLDGECAVRERDPAALVLRTTVVYGPETQGKNFAYQLARRLHTGETVRVPEDQVSSPTYNRDLATATLGLLERGASGTFHVAGAEVMSRVELARRVARAAGLDPDGIEPVPTSALGQRARRPLDAGLRVERLREALPELRLHDVEEAIRDWLRYPRGKPWPTEPPAKSEPRSSA